jgi:hypothetical protein
MEKNLLISGALEHYFIAKMVPSLFNVALMPAYPESIRGMR